MRRGLGMGIGNWDRGVLKNGLKCLLVVVVVGIIVGFSRNNRKVAHLKQRQ